jgi:hypothetical protein
VRKVGSLDGPVGRPRHLRPQQATPQQTNLALESKEASLPPFSACRSVIMRRGCHSNPCRDVLFPDRGKNEPLDSGPKRYDWDKQHHVWFYHRDGDLLHDLLNRELRQALGDDSIEVDLAERDDD